MLLGIVLIVFLVLIIILITYINYKPSNTVTHTKRSEQRNDVVWIPWSWGGGGYGWPGSFYVNRPMPHFYSKH